MMVTGLGLPWHTRGARQCQAAHGSTGARDARSAWHQEAEAGRQEAVIFSNCCFS